MSDLANDAASRAEAMKRVRKRYAAILEALPQQRDSDDLSFLVAETALWDKARKSANEAIL